MIKSINKNILFFSFNFYFIFYCFSLVFIGVFNIDGLFLFIGFKKVDNKYLFIFEKQNKILCQIKFNLS